MLTVKHIIRGTEAVFEAGYVACRKLRADSAMGVVYSEREGTLQRELTEGVVYVMNDTGATVAKYDLYELNRRRPGVEYPPPPGVLDDK